VLLSRVASRKRLKELLPMSLQQFQQLQNILGHRMSPIQIATMTPEEAVAFLLKPQFTIPPLLRSFRTSCPTQTGV